MFLPNIEWYALFVFSSTFLTYNIQRFLKANYSTLEPTKMILWLRSHEKQQYFLMFISAVTVVVSFLKVYQFNFITLLILLVSVIISLLYVFRIRNISLRDIPHLKIHLISVVVVIAIGGFQLVNEENFKLQNWLFVVIHYFYILAITIPFDIRDLKFDDPKQRTIPQVLGVFKSKILSIILLLIYFSLAINIHPILLVNNAFLFTLLITSILIIGVKEKNPEFYCSGLIESSILLLGLSFVL